MRTLKNGTCLFQFDNLLDIPQWIEDNPKRYVDGMTSSTDLARKEWYGGVTFKQSLALVRSGWTEGAKKVDKVKTEKFDRLMGPLADVERTRFNPAVAGGMVVVPQALTGHPACFRRPSVSRKATPVINLWWLVSTNCMMEADSFVNQGVALLAAIDQIEKRGVRVGVTVFSGTYSQGKRWGMSCVVKRYEDRMQIHQLSFPLAHAAYFRRLGFGLMERQCNYDQTIPFRGNYGKPIDRDGDPSKSIEGLVPKDAVSICPNYNDDISDAYDKIHTRLLKELG